MKRKHQFCCRSDPRSSTRRMAENNRNWSLFFAQACWLILVRQSQVLHVLFQSSCNVLFQVASGACQVFGLVTHFFYLAFFAWTGCRIQRIFKIYFEFLLQALRRISSTVLLSPSLIQTGCLISCITRCVFVLPKYLLNWTTYFYNRDITIF